MPPEPELTVDDLDPSANVPPVSDEVGRAFASLVGDGGNGNRLVWSRGPAFFVVSGELGGRSVTVEAAPSGLLPKEAALSLRKVQRIRDAGFESRPGHKALVRHVSLDAPGALARLQQDLVGLFCEVYGESGDDQVAISLGEQEGTRNAPLLDVMKAVAETRDHGLRTDLYRAMLNARLLLLVDSPNEADGPPGAPTIVGDLSGWSVVGGFTDIDQLRRWDPRVPPYQVVPGRVLFPFLVEQPKVGSLLINPRGSLGGELYRNELQTLADACMRRTRR